MTIADGKFFIQNATHDFYLRENGAWVLKGNIGPNGNAGIGPPLESPEPTGLYIDISTGDIYLDGVLIGTLPGGASVGPAGAQGRPGLSIPGLDGDDGEDAWPIPGRPGNDGESITGPAGADGRSIPGNDGDDGESYSIPGRPGEIGASIIGPPGADGEDADSWPIPGQPGQSGVDGATITGPAGADGRTIPGLDGDDGDSWPIPGQPGADGATITGPAGADGRTIPGADGDDGDSWPIPGQPGQPGTDACTIPGLDGDDGDSWPIPGQSGEAGTSIIGPPGSDGEDADSWPIPGQPGADGADGRSIPGADGDDGDSFPIPGRPGLDGIHARSIPGFDGDDGDSWPIPGRPGLDGQSIAAAPGRDGDDGECMPVIPGKDGRSGGLRYQFNSSTLTNVDPGSGKFTLNNTPQSFAWSVMSISTKNADGLNIGLLLQAAMNSGTECIITFKSADGTKIVQAIVLASSLVDNTTYYTLTVSPLGGSSMGDGLEMYLDMDRSGTDAGFRFTFSTNTASTDPGAGKFQVNNSIFGSATTVSFSNTDGRGVNVRAALRRLMNTGTQCVAQGFTRDGARQYPFLVLVTGFVDNTTYDTYGIQPISGAVPTNNDVVFFTFSKFGDQGLQGVSVGIPGRDGEDPDAWPTPFAQSTSVFREVIGAKRTYYVLKTGSDNNTGLANTAAGAFLTMQKAIDATSKIDISTFGVDIQCGAGTYNEIVLVNNAWVGSGIVTLIGDTTTPSNCLIDTTALGGAQTSAPIAVQNGGSLTVKGFKIVNSAGVNVPGIIGKQGGTIRFQNMDFGACGRQIAVAFGSVIATGPYTISAGANYHFFASAGGSVIIEGIAVTITGTPNFTGAYAFGGYNANAIIDSCSYAGSGSVTGKRYECVNGGGVAELSGNVNALPGNVAGTTSNGGWYA